MLSITLAQDLVLSCFWHDEGIDGLELIEIRALVDVKVGGRS